MQISPYLLSIFNEPNISRYSIFAVCINIFRMREFTQIIKKITTILNLKNNNFYVLPKVHDSYLQGLRAIQ